MARAFGYSVGRVTPNTSGREYTKGSALFYVRISEDMEERRSNPKRREVSREKDLWKEHRNEKISYNNTV